MLDYVVTAHLYFKYPGLTPGLITDLRSASVNNECYAQSAVKAGLHKHILHASQDLQRQICSTVEDFDKLNLDSTFGWEAETTFPKVLNTCLQVKDIEEKVTESSFCNPSHCPELHFMPHICLIFWFWFAIGAWRCYRVSWWCDLC